MKFVALIVGLAIAASLAWLAGEQHRENCIRDGKRSCSVLPWDSGEPKPKRSILDERNPYDERPEWLEKYSR
jgi:hypothetical protein